MNPSEKSLQVVNDLINLVEQVHVKGVEAHRITSCLAYLQCLKAEHEKDVLSQKAEVQNDEVAA